MNYDVWMNGGVKAWVKGVPMEEKALSQVMNVASMPFIHNHVAIMPDCHFGYGATVGSVIPTIGAIIPAAVGVDIGCGMMALRTSLRAEDLPDSLSPLRSDIEAAVPHGRTNNGGCGDKGAWRNLPEDAVVGMSNLIDQLHGLVDASPDLVPNKGGDLGERAYSQMGTLGGGNHFIEVCLDTEGMVWIMLHSGSRGVGNRIGSYFIEKAKKDMERWFIRLPDKDLSYFPEGSDHFGQYIIAMEWAQEYASVNRQVMMDRVVSVMNKHFGNFFISKTAINCHHNYTQKERHFGKDVWLTRKGAVSAREGELGIIPGSMGSKSFIVSGKGNAQSFHSCSHGAGRVMSRTEARKTITVAEHEQATAGVECRKGEDVIDESPAAYKNIDDVMAAQADLVDIKYTLKQVLVVKG